MISFIIRLIDWVTTIFVEAFLSVWRLLGAFVDAMTSGPRRRLIFYSVTFGTAFWLIASFGLTYVFPQLTRLWEGPTWEVFESAADRANATILTDSGGRYLGIVDSYFDRDVITEARRPLRLPGYTAYPDHKAAHVDDAPPYYWRCLVHLEDANREGWRNPFGIDLAGVLRIPVSTLSRTIAARRPRIGSGGSTIEMQLARSFMKLYPGSSAAIFRKPLEWNAAPILHRRLMRDGDSRRLRAWAARHIALIQGAGGRYDVFGVEAAGRALFDRSADDLSPAQQIALASAVYRPIVYGNVRSWRALLGEDRDAVSRARRCASAPEVIAEEPLRDAAHAELDAMAQTAPSPQIDPDLAAASEVLGYRPERMGRHPETTANRLARDVQQAVVAELRDRFGSRWRGNVAEVRLTIDIPDNVRFSRAVADAVQTVNENTGPRVRYGGVESPAFARPAGADALASAAPLVVAAADHHGRIVRFVDTSWTSLYAGPSRHRTWTPYGPGAYEIERDSREIASVGKMAAIILMAESGESDPNADWSNECLPGVRWDRSSSRCYGGRDDRETVPARVAMAESLNDAVIGHLARVDGLSDARMDRFMRDLGFILPESHRDTPAPTNVAMGRYVGSPRHVHRLAAFALEYARGNPEAVVSLPTLIESYVRTDPAQELIVDRDAQDLDHDPLTVGDIARPGSTSFAREMLSAPACHEDGTVSGLRDWCPDRNANVRLLIAKSGTRGIGSRAQFNVYDWWLAGGVEFADGRRYSFVAAAGAGDAARPFADDAGGGRLAPMVDALLRDLLENDPRGR